MSAVSVRKMAIHIETVHHDGGPAPALPLTKGAIAAIVANPYASTYEADLLPWMEALRPLAEDMALRLITALGCRAGDIRAFGKGAVVGVNGELEHAAVWHQPGGHGMKSILGAKGFVTSGQIMGAVGTSLHIPMVYVNSPWVRSHFDGIEICVGDAPRPNEVMFALAMSTGGRIHQRLGGLTAEAVERGESPSF